MILVRKNKKAEHIKATSANEVFDVTGAGDCFLAIGAIFHSEDDDNLHFASCLQILPLVK